MHRDWLTWLRSRGGVVPDWIREQCGTFGDWLCWKWQEFRRAPAHLKTHFVRPMLEALEARIVPANAVDIFTGGTKAAPVSWFSDANWSLAAPQTAWTWPKLGTPSVRDGREANGRFAKNNHGGPGNPFARQTAALRKQLLESVTKEDMDAICTTPIWRARAGSVPHIELPASRRACSTWPALAPTAAAASDQGIGGTSGSGLLYLK
jgi:hypothetical protein